MCCWNRLWPEVALSVDTSRMQKTCKPELWEAPPAHRKPGIVYLLPTSSPSTGFMAQDTRLSGTEKCFVPPLGLKLPRKWAKEFIHGHSLKKLKGILSKQDLKDGRCVGTENSGILRQALQVSLKKDVSCAMYGSSPSNYPLSQAGKTVHMHTLLQSRRRGAVQRKFQMRIYVRYLYWAKCCFQKDLI